MSGSGSSLDKTLDNNLQIFQQVVVPCTPENEQNINPIYVPYSQFVDNVDIISYECKSGKRKQLF